MEAVNQLLIALEAHRFGFCFIGAGYENEVDDFFEVNRGLFSRRQCPEVFLDMASTIRSHTGPDG
ncbi:hypothetical protein EB74_03430 [Mycobacterium sp. SWH-M5]|uniref:hypothetical protein n=1 Tax=Mycolicibacterium goodii TaxID=134601 RepID=UPI00093D2B90|nr:hypothetical protein [Mycolicibacterium goodii]MBU8820377.1 hypothetical protein [Mycolicibacterium goodii]OKH66736.1 hypothetical protein EB74_03430 [Mycobacterium sp. SWH-M5]PJK18946.1 hypothetical protein CSX11_28710 [Mycolicibacterium goodii]